MKGGACLLVTAALVALVGPTLLARSPTDQDRARIYEAPSWWHPLGTDALGRDVLARSVHAARYSILTASFGVAMTVLLGTIVGSLSGLFGGLWDRLLMRTTELVMALPALYLILVLRNLFPDDVSPVESGLVVVASLTAVGWAFVARLVRTQVLSIRENDYVTAARASGAGRRQILIGQILPVLLPFVSLQAGLLCPYFFLGEVTLSFLGLGLPEPSPSWGNMLAAAASSASSLAYWWTWLAPALALTVTVLVANLVVEGIRERYFSGSDVGSVSRFAPRDERLTSWATTASRFWPSSMWGSKQRRQRAS